MAYEDWIERFDLRNTALAMLASEAAIDIDNCIRGKDTGDKAVKYLSKLLDDTTQGENPRALLPDNCSVLGYAISSRENFREYWKGKNANEVVLQINLIAKDLRNFKNARRSQQEELRAFCNNLSREVGCNYNNCYSRYSRLAA